MLIVGLTGGMGAGKSTVARRLAEHGATVIDVDAIGRAVLEPGHRAGVLAGREFGPEVLGADGSIDRSSLARVVFSDPDALARLVAISHPAINDELVALMANLPVESIVVLDMAVLAESTLGRSDDRYRYRLVVTVEAPSAVREDRAVERGSDRGDVRRRIANQATDAERRALADVVITNSGTLSDLHEQVDALWQTLCELAAGNDAAPQP